MLKPKAGICFRLYWMVNKMKEKYKALAYVTVPASDNWRWIGSDDGEKAVSDVDTDYVTHINFAFGMIKSYNFEKEKYGCPIKIDGGDITDKEAYRDPSDGKYHYRVTLNGWIEEMDSMVYGERYLKALVELKKKKPDLKVILSVGGWDSDGFCYMAKTQEGRREFSESCAELVREFNLDGIDIDWEFPQNGGWGKIACCDTCTEDAKKLLCELRNVLDKKFPAKHKILSAASGCGVPWIDSEGFKYLDYMNVMCYDYFPGEKCPQADLEHAETYMLEHMKMVGDSKENRRRVNFGVPFYNDAADFLVPYFKEWHGIIDANSEITYEKMDWIKRNGYGGGFYWCYGMDKFECDTDDPKEIKALQKAVYLGLND